MNNYILYMHVCPNKKVYIGQTCQKPEKRWNNGNGYRNNVYFKNAIKKYGWNNIEHIILKDSLTKEEVDLLEIEYIKRYKSNDRRFGYNITAGGDGALSREVSIETKKKMKTANSGKNNPKSKRVLCITTNLYFDCTTQAAQYYSIDSSAISKCCRGIHRTAGKMEWCYIDDNNIPIEKSYQSKKYKQIICKTTNEIFTTMAEACKKYNLQDGNLSKCCKGKQKHCGRLPDGTLLSWAYIEINKL